MLSQLIIFFKNEVSILGIKPWEKEGQNVLVSFLTKIMGIFPDQTFGEGWEKGGIISTEWIQSHILFLSHFQHKLHHKPNLVQNINH